MTQWLTYQQARSLLLEHLKVAPTGDYEAAWRGVLTLACARGLLPGVTVPQGARDVAGCMIGPARSTVANHVQELLWQLLVQGIVVFGQDAVNATWPWYRLTAYGQRVVDGAQPQPHDPDAFLSEFLRVVPTADPVVYDYLEEAVHAFNHGCPKAAAVMLGAASEKAILLLCEAFGSAIADLAERRKFDKNSTKTWSISNKYNVLKGRLDLMVGAKKLQGEHADTVQNLLPGGFELIRRVRNAAGHPEAPGSVDPDTVFLNLRLFTEYARRVCALTEHFATNPADW